MLQREEAARAIMSDARGKAVGSEEFVKIREQKAIEVEERDERREQREINREKSEEEFAKRRDQREQEAHHLMLLREEAARAALSDARGKAVDTEELLKNREQRAIEEEEQGKRREQREIEVEERGKRREQREINREEKEEEYARRRDQREEEDARYKAVDREELLKIQEQRAIAVGERNKRRHGKIKKRPLGLPRRFKVPTTFLQNLLCTCSVLMCRNASNINTLCTFIVNMLLTAFARNTFNILFYKICQAFAGNVLFNRVSKTRVKHAIQQPSGVLYSLELYRSPTLSFSQPPTTPRITPAW